MITTAFVNIWNKRVGAIAWDSSEGTGYFEFDPSFPANNWDLSPVKMPLAEASERVFSFPELRGNMTFKGLPGLLADSLPDRYGNALVNAWLAANGRPADSMNPVELLCFIGKRSTGALEFAPPLQHGSDASTKIEIDSLVKVANDILAGRKNFSASLSGKDEKAMADILKIGTSAGGARAKAVIAFHPETMEVRSGQADAPEGFSHWLIKFDGVADSQFGSSTGYGRVEFAYHLMTLDAGIEMTECRLLEENGRVHFMTRRFDRTEENRKLHLQSFCALQHFDFNDVNSYSYEQLFETIRRLELGYPPVTQVFRRMVFNILARNCDDHTKNFAFLMNEKGEWKLAPAFDMCHAYRSGSIWVSRQALSVNGKRENFTRDDILSLARKMNIKKSIEIIDEINGIVQNWKHYADLTGVSRELKDAIQSTLLKI